MVKEQTVYKGREYDAAHGGPFDRGSADSYYGRGRDPHYYPQGTYKGDRVERLTAEQVEAYYAGYDYNEQFGDKKDWG
jgi:hypothetical protein